MSVLHGLLFATAVTALAVGLAPKTAWGDGLVRLPELKVFPGDDGASASTIDRPLSTLIDAWKTQTGKLRGRSGRRYSGAVRRIRRGGNSGPDRSGLTTFLSDRRVAGSRPPHM